MTTKSPLSEYVSKARGIADNMQIAPNVDRGRDGSADTYYMPGVDYGSDRGGGRGEFQGTPTLTKQFNDFGNYLQVDPNQFVAPDTTDRGSLLGVHPNAPAFFYNANNDVYKYEDPKGAWTKAAEGNQFDKSDYFGKSQDLWSGVNNDQYKDLATRAYNGEELSPLERARILDPNAYGLSKNYDAALDYNPEIGMSAGLWNPLGSSGAETSAYDRLGQGFSDVTGLQLTDEQKNATKQEDAMDKWYNDKLFKKRQAQKSSFMNKLPGLVMGAAGTLVGGPILGGIMGSAVSGGNPIKGALIGGLLQGVSGYTGGLEGGANWEAARALNALEGGAYIPAAETFAGMTPSQLANLAASSGVKMVAGAKPEDVLKGVAQKFAVSNAGGWGL